MAELNSSPAKSVNKPAPKRVPLRVDLTAMVDLAFLLITFFMLTTSLMKQKAMPLAMPADGPPGPVPETRTMTICLGKNNQALWYIGMADKPLTTPKIVRYGKDLQTTILENGKQIARTSGKEMIVLVKPSVHSVYENLVETIDELNIANVSTYAIAAVLPKDADLLKAKGIY
jgi:biopolymer transport protein ExbD